MAPGVLKVRRGPHPAPTGASAKRSSLCGASKVAKVGSGRGSNLLKSPRRRRLTKRSSFSTKRSSPRGRTKVAKVGPLRARVKSAKARAPPYVYYPPALLPCYGPTTVASQAKILGPVGNEHRRRSRSGVGRRSRGGLNVQTSIHAMTRSRNSGVVPRLVGPR